MLGLKDKVTIITGAAQGIGKTIAVKLAKQGAMIVVADVLEEKGVETVKELESLGVKAIFQKVNVADFESVNQMVETCLKEFGRIDGLVNNAGITRDTLLVRMKEEDWEKVIQVNLKGTFNCLKAVAKVMMRQKAGRIVNIASVVGLIGNVGQANYAASKAGVIGLTKTLAKELGGRGINVNAVAPGYIQTEMTEKLSAEAKENFLRNIPLNRPGTPEDVAGVVVFLLSDEAAYITGQVINIDGGLVM